MRRTRLTAILALTLIGALAVSGCDNSLPAEAPSPAPQGAALVAEAEENYLRYRTVTNDLQARLSPEPWEVRQVGSYGMQPHACEDDSSYSFRLSRMTSLDAADRGRNADIAEAFLQDAGFAPVRRTLGEEGSSSQQIQIGVKDEGDFAQLLVTISVEGRVQVSATTVCWPGDRDALSEGIFHGVNLGEGYLPTDTESPSAPLFFGITPGEPQFVRE